MLEGWGATLPLSPPHMEGEGRGRAGRKGGRLGRVGRLCPALPYLIQTRYIQPLLFSDSML